LTEAIKGVRSLDPARHGVIVVDSISHLWEAAVAAYKGKTHGGTIPFHAWGTIKKPYKELMQFLINSPFHVLILGRQANEFAEDEDTGETKAVGVKMKAEGETQYEPHVNVRMESVKPGRKGGQPVVTLFGEKDRTSTIQGRAIPWPTFDTVVKPMLALLGGTQAQVQGEDEAAAIDAEALEQQERERAAASRIKREQFESRFSKAKSLKDVTGIATEIKPVKAQLLPGDVSLLEKAYREARDRCLQSPPPPAKAAPPESQAGDGDPADDEERAAIQAEGRGTLPGVGANGGPYAHGR
jgi:hypothetical protein